MVVLLLRHNRINGCHRMRIDIAQYVKLMGQVLEHHTLNRNGSRHNGLATTEAGDQPQRQTTNATQPVTPAAAIPATLQLCLKDGAMTALVREKLLELLHHARYEKPRHKQLPAVDANRAMLAGMVNLHHAVAEVFSISQEIG